MDLFVNFKNCIDKLIKKNGFFPLSCIKLSILKQIKLTYWRKSLLRHIKAKKNSKNQFTFYTIYLKISFVIRTCNNYFYIQVIYIPIESYFNYRYRSYKLKKIINY